MDLEHGGQLALGQWLAGGGGAGDVGDGAQLARLLCAEDGGRHRGHAELVAHDVLAEQAGHALVVRLRRVGPTLPRAALSALKALRRRLARSQSLEAGEGLPLPAYTLPPLSWLGLGLGLG